MWTNFPIKPGNTYWKMPLFLKKIKLKKEHIELFPVITIFVSNRNKSIIVILKKKQFRSLWKYLNFLWWRRENRITDIKVNWDTIFSPRFLRNKNTFFSIFIMINNVWNARYINFHQLFYTRIYTLHSHSKRNNHF